ncbi:hypothetical protein MUO14_23165 [Halobacillus shinanisalinarum]|uniref:Uncharacterized protein n=1 Tax=Halobacillus shinanisalinarum TaxID=2932258 RepID=A0ABY4GZA4_9BACI|nr:hypothetical protein [Halobacillus shinanisalinarum]UOQ93243.1 hypothetical protein MUO14_23165 [Halobacillus shinanisalinarum]
MVYFLLAVSFILHGVLILIIIILFNKVKQTEELESRQKQVSREIEEVFHAYLLEIKEENAKMDDWFKYSSEQSKQRLDQNRTDAEEKTDYTPPLPLEGEEDYQPSIQSSVIGMYQNGTSMEEIARELNMGKTEVELLVKFQHIK